MKAIWYYLVEVFTHCRRGELYWSSMVWPFVDLFKGHLKVNIVPCATCGKRVSILYFNGRKGRKDDPSNKVRRVLNPTWGFHENPNAQLWGPYIECGNCDERHIARIKLDQDMRSRHGTKKDYADGGCWYCEYADSPMFFSFEFDCYVHESCIAQALTLDEFDGEAKIMWRELIPSYNEKINAWFEIEKALEMDRVM